MINDNENESEYEKYVTQKRHKYIVINRRF